MKDLGKDHPFTRLGCTDADRCPRASATCGTEEEPCPPLKDLGYLAWEWWGGR